jgi:hypothetical protein
MSYNDLKQVSKGTRLEAHHLIEKRFAEILGIKQGDILSIAIEPKLHYEITALYRDYLP